MKIVGIVAVVLAGVLGLAASIALFGLTMPRRRPEAHQAEVSGVVLDQATRQPIAGACIQIASPAISSDSGLVVRLQTRTDERGAFRARTAVDGDMLFGARKRGYFNGGTLVDPARPVEIHLQAVPTDSGFNLCQAGLMHPEMEAMIRLECGRGALAPGEEGEDIRLTAGPNATLTIDAAPGRSVRWMSIEEGGQPGVPTNCCEAPDDGYVATLSIPANSARGLCFVRRDARHQYGGFSIDPGLFTSGKPWAIRYITVFNETGGRGLCTEGKMAWAALP